MKKIWLLVLLIPFFAGCHKKPVIQTKKPDSFIRGADLSFLPELEDQQSVFYDNNGQSKPALQIFKEQGCNTIRIRLWHTPDGPHSSLKEVSTFAQQVRDAGMKVYKK